MHTSLSSWSFGHKFLMVVLTLLIGGVVFVLGTTLLVILCEQSEGYSRGAWESLLLLFVTFAIALPICEVWSICKHDKHFFEDQMRRAVRNHQKAMDIARVWLISLFFVALVTGFAYSSYTPTQDERNFMMMIVAAGFDVSILWYAIKRTRRIRLRVYSRFYGF